MTMIINAQRLVVAPGHQIDVEVEARPETGGPPTWRPVGTIFREWHDSETTSTPEVYAAIVAAGVYPGVSRTLRLGTYPNLIAARDAILAALHMRVVEWVPAPPVPGADGAAAVLDDY